MQAKRYTHADHSVGEFLHVSEFIPEQYRSGEHFASAMYHAKQIGQTKTEHRLNWKRHILEGLK